MTRIFAVALFGVAFAGVPMLVGCDDKTSKTETKTTNPDGSGTVDKEKTTTDSKGDVKTTTEHKETAPKNNNATTQP